MRLLLYLAAVGLATTTAACGEDASPTEAPPPRPPPAIRTFDLRFKGVGVLSSATNVFHSDIDATTRSFLSLGFSGAAGTPLELGDGDCSAVSCAWFFDVFAIPSDVAPISTFYSGDLLANSRFDFTTAATDTVIESLDVELGDSIFGMARMATSQAGGYHLTRHIVPLAALDSAAAAEGRARRVITAVSFDSAQVLFLSYAWDHDSATAGYDTRVASTGLGAIPAVADSLALAGYVITALGGNPADGFVLVGTRVHGAIDPRSLLANPDPTILDLSGYAPVGYLDQVTRGSALAATLLVEK